jgi:succinate dehydrogenase/fumarate reductase-like Fe-S protein
MAGGIRKLKGDLYMGYRAIIAHPLRKLFSEDERTGRQKFLDNYAPEGLVPTTPDDREVLNQASRCIHCGLCDAYDPSLSALPRTVYDGVSLLPVSYSRATPDIPRARQALGRIRPEDLARAEAVCPTRVPLRRIAAYLQRKLAELDRVQDRAP